ncbi:MAG: hypothetical protein N2247_13805 [Leptospiraceae bacterium]|jgi:hypothetical protein|nr:hypothetical protein [Leptospiraceae bacterium]
MEKENLLDTLLRIRDRIKEINNNVYEEAIPTSDIIFRKYLNDLVYSEDMARYYLKLLAESNFIFMIQIVKPDTILKIPGIDGYVVAELDIIEKLLAVYNQRLVTIYEAEKRKLAGVETIIRELMPKVKELNNTPLGKVLNICIMLEQFTRIIHERPDHFQDAYRISKLKQFIPEEDEFKEPEEEHEKIQQVEEIRRAVDTEEYQQLSKMNLTGNWAKAVEQFGVQFLIRVHLRKYEFDVLKKLLLQKRIAREEDLIFLRDSLRKMEERSLFNPELKKYLNEIKELKRIVQIKINQFYLIRKKYEG